MKFQIGDVVICNNDDGQPFIEKGYVYKVLAVKPNDDILIIDNDETKNWYMAERFKPFNEFDKTLIETQKNKNMKALYSPKTDLAVNIFNALVKSGDIELLPPNKEDFAKRAKAEMDELVDKIEKQFPFVKGTVVTQDLIKNPTHKQVKNGLEKGFFKINKHNKRDSKGRFKKTENWCEFVYTKSTFPVYEKEVKQIKLDYENDEYICGFYRNGEYRKFRKNKIVGEIFYWKE